MRSVIPTRSSRSPTGLQAAVLLGVAGLAASIWLAQSKKRNAARIRAPRRDGA